MRGKGRVPTELVRRREQAGLDLAAKGLSETEIADELDKQGLGKVTQQAVSKMLIRVEKRQLAEMSEQVKLMKVRQTASLRKIHRDAIAAWEESKKPQKSLTTKHGPSGDNGEPGKVTESQSVLRDQDGDPRFLELALHALADLRKVWGVDEPKKIAPTTPDGKLPYAPLTDAERRAALARLYASVGAGSGGEAVAGGDDFPGPLAGGPDLDSGSGGDDAGPVAGQTVASELDEGVAPLFPPGGQIPSGRGVGTG